MYIFESCKCGARFKVEHRNTNKVIGVWVTWLNAHAPCRGDDRAPLRFTSGSVTVSERSERRKSG